MQNRKSLTESISPDVSTFLEEGKAKPQKKEKEEKQEITFSQEGELKTFSCRLSSSLINELLMISAKRKIYKQKPNTQGEILSEALKDWLVKNN